MKKVFGYFSKFLVLFFILVLHVNCNSNDHGTVLSRTIVDPDFVVSQHNGIFDVYVTSCHHSDCQTYECTGTSLTNCDLLGRKCRNFDLITVPYHDELHPGFNFKVCRSANIISFVFLDQEGVQGNQFEYVNFERTELAAAKALGFKVNLKKVNDSKKNVKIKFSQDAELAQCAFKSKKTPNESYAMDLLGRYIEVDQAVQMISCIVPSEYKDVFDEI